MKGIRSISGSSVPVYALQTGSAAYLIFRYGPESSGGNGDMAEKISTIRERNTNISEEEWEKQMELVR